MNDLRATGRKVGLLINFSYFPGVEHERLVIRVQERIPKPRPGRFSLSVWSVSSVVVAAFEVIGWSEPRNTRNTWKATGETEH